jgi:hypothetical protein
MRKKLVEVVSLAAAVVVGSWSGPAWCQNVPERSSAAQTADTAADGAGTNALGAAAADLLYTPVTPCRIIDTRLSAAGMLVSGVDRGFKVRDAAGFAAQGGSPSDCGIPLAATVVEMNLVAVAPAGPGDLRVVAFPGTLPTASVLNYTSVPGLNIANGLAQPVCNASAASCTSDVTVRADVSGTHLVADVVGYFKAPVRPTLITLSDSAGSTGSATPITIASMFSDLLGKGYTKARLVARFNGQQEDPICTGRVILELVDADRQATLASLDRECAVRAWYDQSPVFNIQAPFAPAGTSYDLRASGHGGAGSWRWVALEVW